MIGGGQTPASADGYLLPPVLGHDPQNCPDFITPTQRLANPISEWSQRTIELSVAVHPTYVDFEGADWQQDMDDLIGSASAVYDNIFNIDIEVVHTDILAEGDIVLQNSGSQTLTDLIDHYQTNHAGLEREVTLLLVGDVIQENANGRVVGQVECVGGAINPDKYSFMVVDTSVSDWGWSFLGFEFLEDVRVKTLVHEMGHLFAAHHHYGNCAEGAPAYDPTTPTDACTVMSPYLDMLGMQFSTHNKLLIRAWAEYVEI